MRLRRSPFLTLLPLLALLGGCASPAKLAERSHDALAAGDLRKAYEMARRALEKDPSHPDARSAFGAAATRIAIDYRTRIGRLAPIDTIDLLYFSFTTLTSTGYGDITPLIRPARSLCVIEQVTGTLYLTILIARLAGVYPPSPRQRN